MNKKEQSITGNVRARYTSPRMKVVELHARNRILSGSNGVNEWTSGSDTEGGDMVENKGWGERR